MKSEGSCHPGCLGQFIEQSRKSHWKIPQPDKQGLWNGFSSYKEVTWPSNTKNQVNLKFYTYENTLSGHQCHFPVPESPGFFPYPFLPLLYHSLPPTLLPSPLPPRSPPALRLCSGCSQSQMLPSCLSCPTLIASAKALQHSVPQTVFRSSGSTLLYNPNWFHP